MPFFEIARIGTRLLEVEGTDLEDALQEAPNRDFGSEVDYEYHEAGSYSIVEEGESALLKDDSTVTLSLLEELLSITEGYKDQMSREDREKWQRISAACADFREEKE